ncbi:MAG: type II toxin-antitoxin system RelE/ParE family toxin [Fulvivirga sp.]|uniref:type II toxin-antitoxin system RelE/ParE family toxin n=1 Tax=Fulvivirga sp. TaxID=1931237 RepID=UPI0032EC81C8
MAKKQIIWSSKANNELKNILDFYNQRNGNTKYSLKLLNEIDDLLNTLSDSEFIGRLTENKKTRVVVMKVYLIFYEINGNRIEILSFWDNRQDTKKRITI